MGKKYSQRINQLIQRKVTQLLLEHSNDPRLSEVTITDVSVNRDTTRAEVFFSIIGTPDEIAAVQQALNGASGWLRREMAPTLRLRNLPALVFVYDPSLAHGARIEELLHQLQEEDKIHGSAPDITDGVNGDSLDADEGDFDPAEE